VNKSNLQKWTLFAELSSATAVVITLVFLVVGMRENTNALQAQTFQELMRDVNNWRSSINQTERLRILSKFRLEEDGELTREETRAVRLIFLELWGIYEAAYFANERDVLGDEEWRRFEAMICFERNGASGDAFWNSASEGLVSFAGALTPSFVEFVDSQCTPDPL
jgi:hypothetical protein